MSDINIKFTAWFGDTAKTVEIAQVMGMGDGIHLYLYINRYYQGCLFKRDGKWIAPDGLTADDIAILADMIDNFQKERGVSFG